MDYEVELPDLGPEGGDRATVAEWNFDEGEYVEQGDVLLEVTCDAGTLDVISPRSGVLVERIVEEDEIVRIGEPVAVLDVDEDEGETEEMREEPPTRNIGEMEEELLDDEEA